MATEKQVRQKVLDTADKYLGLEEGGSLHQDIVDTFNSTGLCSRYKLTLKDSWCISFVCAILVKAGYTSVAKDFYECSCENAVKLADKAGIWVEDDDYVPEIADVIMYNWSDTSKYATTDNTGTANHTGFVYSVDKTKKTFVVIEGNKSDTVSYRDMDINGKYIRGFITPKYSSVASSSSSSSSSSTATSSTSSSSASSSTSTTTTSSSSSSSKTTTTTSTKFKAKDKIKLSKVALYASSDATKSSGTKTGTFYIWDATVVNGRIRITTTTAGCGVASKVTGWVDEDDIPTTTTTTTSSSTTYSKEVKWTGKVTTKGSNLNVRKGPGTSYAKLTTYPSLKNGTTVSVCDSATDKSGNKWYYICYKNRYGFVSADYITKVS